MKRTFCKMFSSVNLFYIKHKEVLLYLFFGFLTTIISIISFTVAYEFFAINEHIANIISWFFAVTFAFFTNRKWVFNGASTSDTPFIKQMFSFYAGRLVTLGIEEIIVLIFISILNLPALFVKTTAQVVVLVLNYIISKFLIFKKK